jgi:hypothetical protein
MKIIFLLISGGGEAHEADELSQRKTWASAQSTDTEIIWLRGRPGNEYSLESNTLYVPCENDFTSILEKTILGFRWVASNRNYDLVVRSNTSTYFNLEALTRNFSKFDLSSVGGTFETSRKPFGEYAKGYRYLNGSGLYLGNSAVNLICNMDHQGYRDLPDDFAIHSFFEDSGIGFYHVPRNNLDLHHMFFPRFQVRVKSWSRNDLTVSRMYYVHAYFQCRTFYSRFRQWIRIELLEYSNSEISMNSLRNFRRRILNYFKQI